MNKLTRGAIFLFLCIPGRTFSQTAIVEQWETIELSFQSKNAYVNPYTDVEVWAWFVNDRNDSIVRPAFWNGGSSWIIRFAPVDVDHTWSWQLYSSGPDEGFIGEKGQIRSVANKSPNGLLKNGLLQISPGRRNLIHANGKPRLLVGDTPWALLFRATQEQVRIYAKDRHQKGFNTALLIAVQPDQYAVGPPSRNTDQGFARGFEDFATGHLNELNPEYFNTLDSLIAILNEYEIAPVFAPLAHGYGWKGKKSMGPTIDAEEYARLCKYLVARYGSRPACWLISLDGNGNAPAVVPAGEAIEKWDSYRQPVGLHYNPCDDFLATWATGDSSHCFHYNKMHQEKNWLDFQWAQTGHDGKHLYHKVERMYENKPVKAVMNGEPTYEKMNEGQHGLGWWQGEDAWNELMHGGTMGVVYGAVCLWQWKINAGENGWEKWTDARYSWREALDFEGSRYVGAIGKALDGFDFTDMEIRKDLCDPGKQLLAKEGIFYCSYLPEGGTIEIKNVPDMLDVFWFDPRSVKFHRAKKSTRDGAKFTAPSTSQPWVLIIGKRDI